MEQKIELETTAEQRAAWKSTGHFKAQPIDTVYMWQRIEKLCRDLDGALAEIARLTRMAEITAVALTNAEDAEAKWRRLYDGQKAEIARLTAALAEADTTLKDLHSGMSFDAAAREAAAREEERNAFKLIIERVSLPEAARRELLSLVRARSQP